MDVFKYKAILEENLFQSAKDLRLWQSVTLQHDNEAKITAKFTVELFKTKNLKGSTWKVLPQLVSIRPDRVI